MAKRKFKKDDKEFQFFNDYWKFVQDFASVEESEDYWAELVGQSEMLCKKNGYDRFVVDLVEAYISCLERKRREYQQIELFKGELK